MVEPFSLVYNRYELAKPTRSIVHCDHELVHGCRADFGTIRPSMATDHRQTRLARSLRACVALAVASAGLALTACGGGEDAGRTLPAVPAKKRAATSAEVEWEHAVDRFAATLAVDLERIQALTGGGPSAGPIGPRPVGGVFAGGPARRRFDDATSSLARCRRRLDGLVPNPPTHRLEPVRIALGTACSTLASAASSLTSAVGRARSPRGVDPAALALARGQARQGLRLVVDALAILRRIVETPR